MQSRPSRVRPMKGDGRGRARERWELACAENSGWTHRTQRGMTWGGREWRAGGVRPRARQRVITRSVVQRGMVLPRVSGVKLGRISRWISSNYAQDKCHAPGPHREAVGVMPKSPQRVITRSKRVGNATCARLLFREFEQTRIEGSNAAPAAHGSENPTGVWDAEAASPSHTLAAFWHPIDADAWRAPSFAAGADAARGARAELEERALRGRIRAGWTRWSTEASVRPAAAWIEDVQHALIGPRGVCSHGRRRWERMGDFRPSHMLERV